MSYRLLLVDDDPGILKAIGEYFERVGHEVHRAANGKSGLIEFNRSHPDVVVLDLHLPDMSGMEVLAEIRKRGGSVVMLTGEGDIDSAVEAMRLGAENFLRKPVELPHLVATVEKAAEKAILRREVTELRAQLTPRLRRQVMRALLFILFVVAALFVGRWIGGGQEARQAAPIPVPLPNDTLTRSKGDSMFRPQLGPNPGPSGLSAPGGTPAPRGGRGG